MPALIIPQFLSIATASQEVQRAVVRLSNIF